MHGKKCLMWGRVRLFLYCFIRLCDMVGQCFICTYGSLLSERFRYRSLLQMLIKMIEMFFLAALVGSSSSQKHPPPHNVQNCVTVKVVASVIQTGWKLDVLFVEQYAMCGSMVSYCSLKYLTRKECFPVNRCFFSNYKKISLLSQLTPEVISNHAEIIGFLHRLLEIQPSYLYPSSQRRSVAFKTI